MHMNLLFLEYDKFQGITVTLANFVRELYLKQSITISMSLEVSKLTLTFYRSFAFNSRKQSSGMVASEFSAN